MKSMEINNNLEGRERVILHSGINCFCSKEFFLFYLNW